MKTKMLALSENIRIKQHLREQTEVRKDTMGMLQSFLAQSGLNLRPDQRERLVTKMSDQIGAMLFFNEYPKVRWASMFGTARIDRNDPVYIQARELASKLSQAGWGIISGGGPGAMAAFSEGGMNGPNIGLGIVLPFEQGFNPYLQDFQQILFNYFSTRKDQFVEVASASSSHPGGFGTHDETPMIMTLVQCGKIPLMPLLLVDPPGSNYWHQWLRYFQKDVLPEGYINQSDLNLLFHTQNTDEALQHILHFYRNFHSMRREENLITLNLNHPLNQLHVRQLIAQYPAIINRQQVERVGMEHLPDEAGHYAFTFPINKDYQGVLRHMVDRINTWDLGPT